VKNAKDYLSKSVFISIKATFSSAKPNILNIYLTEWFKFIANFARWN